MTDFKQCLKKQIIMGIMMTKFFLDICLIKKLKQSKYCFYYEYINCLLNLINFKGNDLFY